MRVLLHGQTGGNAPSAGTYRQAAELCIGVADAAGLRFNRDGVLLPPDWEAQQAGQRLVDIANKLYSGTAIQ
jgi:hypothetical protein